MLPYPRLVQALKTCPLLKVIKCLAGNLQMVQVSYSMQDFLQINADLGYCSEDPEKYIDDLWKLSLTFYLTWKDIHVIIEQTFSKAQREIIMNVSTHYADSLFITIPNYPIGVIY